MEPTTRILKQGVIGISQFFSLQAAKEGNANILWNSAEIFTKMLSFSDFEQQSLIGAAGISIGSLVDDVMIGNGVYQEHQLAKLVCAMYAGYKLSLNDTIKKSTDSTLKSDILTSSAIGVGLFVLSKLLGSGDIINSMRSNTKDCIEFSDKVFELSDGTVNPYNDLLVGAGINTVIGGGRQFLNDIKLDMGGMTSDFVKASVTSSVNIGIGLKSTKDFKHALISKFSSIDERTLIELEKDYRAQKVMENLLSNIDKASKSITKTAVNYSVKNSWQQILANQKDDVGLSSFIASNLFNNFKIQNKKSYKSDEFESAVKNKDILEIRQQIKAQEKSGDKLSYTSELFSFFNKSIEYFLSPLAASFLVSAMQGQGEEIKFYQSEAFSKYFTPITSTVGMSLLSTEDDSQEALDDIQYLYGKIIEIQDSYYSH